MQEIFLDDTWQNDLDDSDKDQDFIPEAKKSQKQAIDGEAGEEYLLSGSTAHQATEGDPQNQSNHNVSNSKKTLSPHAQCGNRRRKTLSETNTTKFGKQRKKREVYQRIKSGCLGTCSRSTKCCDFFTDDDRININMHFWSLDYSGRKSFGLERVNRHECGEKKSKWS
ncbi:hypothetical protein RRG08_016427 [Elysia crispata]|uniref:Uncharacterized protein n=1 Tax=Elysia crispata TaxID=231223 RepID=A0AAE1CV00_9GAST|nr:hypothetical protein RRG08_016427 [Elysia crispata]